MKTTKNEHFPNISELTHKEEKKVQEDWDIYWKNKKKATISLYDTIASFYRKYIIINILNHFIKKYFNKEDKVLHAGCGSGEVDIDLVNYLKVTALDISPNALDTYKRIHKNKTKIINGSVFNLPFNENVFDGIYNLGVMEHFNQEDIQKILIEFYHVLKPKGKIAIFWPPVFGLTVNFLDTVHFIMNEIFRKNIKLHPDEVSRLKSKEQAEFILKGAGFELIEYYFGIRDLFTQAVIIAEKR